MTEAMVVGWEVGNGGGVNVIGQCRDAATVSTTENMLLKNGVTFDVFLSLIAVLCV